MVDTNADWYSETHIDSFEFKKLPRLDKGNEAIRRATLTNDEYETLYRAMRTYCAKHNKLDENELRVRKNVLFIPLTNL